VSYQQRRTDTVRGRQVSVIRRLIAPVIALGGSLLTAGVSSAGVYPLLAPDVVVRPGLPFAEFQTSFRELASIAKTDMPIMPLRQQYLQRVEELRTREAAGLLSADERLELGARLLRLGELDRAAAVLHPLTERDDADPFALADLASVFQGGGFWERARDAQERALKLWPRVRAGWTSAELSWRRRAEEYALKFMALHVEEARRPTPERAQDVNSLIEAFFPGVRLVGESGTFEAGELAAARRTRLPADAVRLVEQLLLGMPVEADLRLYWLLADLLNAEGDAMSASRIVEELVYDRRFNAPALLQQRQILNQAKALDPIIRDGWLAYVLAPRPAPTPLSEASWAAIMKELRRRQEPLAGTVLVENSQPPAVNSVWPERRRLLLVGGIVAALVVLLAYLQGYLAGRRRPRPMGPRSHG
jgi:hypothetical protein